MSGSGRKLNPLEQKLHQAALADPKKTITQKECDALVPDPSARLAATNFLLGTGLWKALRDSSGALTYRVVTKKELEVKKDMSGEEGMILSYIQASGNEGIWTKHLKAKTELHQTVIDRCLKSLVQKQLIKAVKSVQVGYPTRKIYMLYHLEPSVEMTGGPWYTDNELDTEFIKLLCSACLRFIRDRSTPKPKGADPSSSSANQPLHPISAAPAYPTAQQVLTFLSKSRITETQLATEHVEKLLNVLILDGEIERIPAFGAAMWDASESNNAADASGSEDEDEDGGRRDKKDKRKKRKRRDEESPRRDRKRSKRSRSESESDAESDSQESEDERERRRKKDKGRKKSKSRAASNDDESDEASERETRRRKKKRSRETSEGEDVEMSDAERKSKSSGKSKKRKKSRRYESESESSDSGSDSDGGRRAHSRSKSRSSTHSKRKRSASPEDVTASLLGQDYGAYVYRAVRQERAGGGGGGLAQTPCVRCPVFEFCKDGGPVNPRECEYYGNWLVAADVAIG
ncbi:hypothetical protein DICSQDRAFT_105558 [Dichomitus squalens LYAD-421 SS1]|uniref:RNA polymerase Rpc34 subunit-domain-containing protein n=1 Tax=Dichomitus squalens (strain LYAD-421) TaxID=732165 RepID=R7T2Q1_DICSQ|nr:uncharacterized protein DICSQDRAFT_105558 [Dichomitus squalens LYAD-421 SS1]EJF61847.1 hypothetical protein DICSQDRAFT_105558 [Dichomitus squalens LYAD-421 SS1]